MSVRSLLFCTLCLPLFAQDPKTIAYPQRDLLSPFRAPKDAYPPQEELFRLLRIMEHLADDPRTPKSFDAEGREVVDDPRWKQASKDLAKLDLDAGMLAQIIRLNRHAPDRATAFYAAFRVLKPGDVIELIQHIPGEPLRQTREKAFPRALEFLRKNLARRFGDLPKEQRDDIVAQMPKPGSPAAKSRGIVRLPDDADTLHTLRVIPFLQMLDLDEAIDQAQALWFCKEVFTLRGDLALMWLEPALPRVRELLLSESAEVRKEAIGLFQVIAPKDFKAPPTEPRELVDWADQASKALFPPIRNLNDTIVQLHPSPERDAVIAAGIEALQTSAIGDPFRGQGADGQWTTGFRVLRVPELLKPLAIPVNAIVTLVNGVVVTDGPSLLATVKSQLELAKHPRTLFVEYVLDGKPHAVEYRVQ
jgi:hypothetical protein